ncbi:hypothetical protein [Sphingomonas crusticola]|uniref:hypothetical protein n=1 Tax=Sphingomonas crusticola TaxID=1697973 RepID=UPI0013C33BF1|nr:hypothetical protein [Sphingomonas crusticola]
MRAMMVLPLMAATIQAGPAAAVTPMSPTAGADVEGHAIFYAYRQRKWDEIGVKLPPPSRLRTIIPFAEGRFGMISYECGILRKSGRLSGCQTRIDPANQGYEGAARKLLQELRVTGQPPASSRPPITYVWVQLRLYNTIRPAHSGPCWPPACVATPAPPPPPPASPPR